MLKTSLLLLSLSIPGISSAYCLIDARCEPINLRATSWSQLSTEAQHKIDSTANAVRIVVVSESNGIRTRKTAIYDNRYIGIRESTYFFESSHVRDVIAEYTDNYRKSLSQCQRQISDLNDFSQCRAQ